jgi:hypothetical protein
MLYRAARLSASGRAVRKGYVPRRAKNIVVGRALGRAGFWTRSTRASDSQLNSLTVTQTLHGGSNLGPTLPALSTRCQRT